MKNSPAEALGQAMPPITQGDPSTMQPTEEETSAHLHHLVKAHEIINDPVKMAAVHKLAGRHDKAIKSIQDIKNYNQAKYGKPAGVQMLHNNVENEAPADDSSGF